MDAVCEATDRLLHWDFSFLAHRPAGEQRFRVVSIIDTAEGQRQSFPGYEADPREFSEQVRQVFEGLPVLINRGPGESQPRLIPLGTGRSSASLMFVPVRCEGRIIGFLSAQSYTPGRYGEPDLQFLRDVADAVAPALERVHAEESLRRSQAILRVQRDLALDLSATGDLGAALDRLLESCLAIEAIDAGGVYVRSDEGDDLDLVSHRGLSAGFVESVSRITTDGCRGRVVACGQPVFLSRAELESVDQACRAEGLRALACIPVISGGRLMALLNLASRTFDEIPRRSRNDLEAIAAQMGSAIARIRAEKGLREARDLLEKRVQERTAELVEANRRLQAEIAERARAEQALRESEERYRAIVEGQTELICRFASDGRILFLNDACCRRFGLSREQVAGKSFLPLILEEDRASVEAQLASLSPAKPVITIEERIRTPDGAIRWYQWTNRGFFTDDGALREVLAVGRDITERKRAEDALRESEMNYRTVIDTTGMGYNVVDAAGRVLDANEEYVRLSGHDSLAAILGRPVTDWTAPHDRERNAREVALCAAEGAVRHLEIDYIDRNGRITPVEINATRTQTAEGPRIIAICRDITDRRQAEAALWEKEEQLRLLSENLADGMVYQINSGPDGQRRQFTYVSPAVQRLHGLKVEDVLRDSSLIYRQVIEEDRAMVAEREARAFAARTTLDVDARVRLASGEIRWRRFISSPRALPDGTLVWDGIELDITEQKKAQEALLRQEKELRLLGVRANRRLEEERARVSRELHDELGQMLTALNLNLNWLGRRIGDVQADVTERIDESVQYVGRLMASVRSLSQSLRPAALSHGGLIEAVRRQAAEFEQFSGIPCDVSFEPADLEVSEPVATAAFRIVQEALTNVARHARATECSIEIQNATELLLMTITDNGVGLPAERSADTASLGIAGMRERAAMLGGRVSVQNRPCGGVCVSVQLPMTPQGPELRDP